MKINTDPEKIKELLERGVEDVIVRENLEKRLKAGSKLRVKFGIDPTSSSIHLGNAIPIWKLRQFQDLGHQIVFLIGDFTARIGDTSDKTAIRQPMAEEEIAGNMKTYKEQLGKILDLDKTEFVYNSHWLDKLTYKEILNLQSQFTVAQMVERENFHDRYKAGKPIGLQEFSYPLMQGYDSVAVKADVEIGGTDQTFNLLAGREIQRAYSQEPQDIMTLTLLEGTDGRKMSKSYGNVINIADTPDDMYGKVMSMADELIIKYFTLCAKIPLEEIGGIEEEIKKEKVNPRDAKARLAREIVKSYHGEEEALKAEEEFNRVFREKELPSEMPEIRIKDGEYQILDFLAENKLAPSKTEAKRLIMQNAVKIRLSASGQTPAAEQLKNWQVENDWQKTLEIKKGEEVIIQVGKRKFAKIIGI
jgi:tyrosyl-tRNA synthetase